jgi:hypothetical protein
LEEQRQAARAGLKKGSRVRSIKTRIETKRSKP